MTSGHQYNEELKARIEARFLESLRRHLSGWRAKVAGDFSEEAFQEELQRLRSDAVYQQFGFARPEYVLVRLMGRVSISIGRRLGEIYDKVPRFVAAARFSLPESDVVEKLDGLEADLILRTAKLAPIDSTYVVSLMQMRFRQPPMPNGVAIEIRYNFNPNDSARLRKDMQLAELVKSQGLFPVYLIISGISPRHDAIARLSRAGWNFLAGSDAITFLRNLLGIDLQEFLQRPAIKKEVEMQVNEIMRMIFTSFAFGQANVGYAQRQS